MQKDLFLITGATGSTGKFTVDELLRNGNKVRAFVHKADSRSEELDKKGAEVFVGDLQNLDSVRAALDGVTAAYFTMTVDADLIPATAFFAQAAKEVGIKAVVNMSQISARLEAKSRTTFNHWIGEKIFAGSGVPVVHLRPTFFAEWLLYPFILHQNKKGLVEWGWSTGKHAPVAAEDQARLIAAILQNPEPHVGKAYRICGPKEYTAAELYAEVSRALGREVKYRTLSESEFKKRLAGLGRPVLAQHFENVNNDHTNGLFAGTDDVIGRVTGKPPIGITEFIAKNRSAFELS